MYCHTIDNKQVSSTGTYPVINPSTGESFADAPLANAEVVNDAVAAARRAFSSWSLTSVDERKQYLGKMIEAVKANMQELVETLVKEQGKPLNSAKQEVGFSIMIMGGVTTYNIPTVVLSDDEKSKTVVVRKPVGVVACITPWNFPVMMAVSKIAPAILCGCTVVLKPSPFTPLTSLILGRIFAEVLPAGVVNVISGDNQSGELLVRHPNINKVSFTGSVATGKKIMEACSGDLKRVTLELGGNDAAIVREDVDVQKAAEGIIVAAMMNSGQVCAAVKRVYVHESKYAEFCEAAAAAASQCKFGDGFSADVTHGPVNNKMQFDRVKELVEDAKAHGGKVLCGGAPTTEKGYFFPATVVTGIKEGVRLVDEEQFGPVLPIMSYSTDEEALQRANSTKFGLCGSVWTSDLTKGSQIASQLECGTAWVNRHAELLPGAPFGGVKCSGLGREHSADSAVEAFTEAQVIFVPKFA
jgi:aldehyde dehydrogenase (NAD+)